MIKNLNLIEENDIRELIESPELSYFTDDISDRRRISINISSRKPEDILLINKNGFLIDSVFSGLTQRHIEYFAKHAPLEYKQELLKIFKDQEMMNGIWEIVKSLDEDAGEGNSSNQERIKNVIRYIQDNQTAFKSQYGTINK